MRKSSQSASGKIVYVKDIAMQLLREISDAPSVDDWSRKQTSAMIPYEKLEKLKTLFFFKMPSPRRMIASGRRRTAYMETQVPSGKAVDRVVNQAVIDYVTEAQLDEDADDAGGRVPEPQVSSTSSALALAVIA